MLAIPLLLAALSPAHAEDAPPVPSVKMSGVIFAHYGFLLTEGRDNFNEFALDRVYLRADGDLGHKLGTRVTLDANRFSDPTVDARYRVFIKTAYLEWKEPVDGIKLRAGMVDGLYGPYLDDLWGHRFVRDNYPSVSIKLPTADLGVSVLGKHADGLIDWAAAVLNGEGYTKPELDAGKSFQGRFTLDPLYKMDGNRLPLVLWGEARLNPGGPATINASFAANYIGDYATVQALAMYSATGDVSGFGYSIAALPGLPKVGSLLFRYDSWDPDSSTDDDASSVLVAGVSKFWIPKKVATTLDYERTTLQAAPDAPDHGIFVHMMAGF